MNSKDLTKREISARIKEIRKNIFVNKRTIKFSIIGIVALLVIGGVWYVKEKQFNKSQKIAVGSRNTSVLQSTDFSEKNKVLTRAKITGVQNVDAVYKKVSINDGQVTFSFEVPNEWLVETRNSGEVQMNESELRDFFATSYSGDIKKDSKLSGDYWDFTWAMLKDMSYDEMKRFYDKFRHDSSFGYPNASVSSNGHVVYTDVNTQTDFYILSDKTDKQYYDGKSLGVENAKWSDVKNDYPNGSFKSVYVSFPNSDKVLFIRVYIETSDNLKQEIDRMLSTLRFE